MVSLLSLADLCLSTLTDYLSNCRLTQFVITKALPYIFSSLGYGTWFFFASWMLLATVWAFFFLPETKGKTLDEIDVILYVQPVVVSFQVAFMFANTTFHRSGYSEDRREFFPGQSNGEVIKEDAEVFTKD